MMFRFVCFSREINNKMLLRLKSSWLGIFFIECLNVTHKHSPRIGSLVFCYPLRHLAALGPSPLIAFTGIFLWSWWYSSTCWNETVALDIGTIMILKLEALLIDNTALPPYCYLTNLQLLMFCLDIFFSLSLFMMKRYLGNHWTKKIWSAKSVVRMFTIFMQQRSSFSLVI